MKIKRTPRCSKTFKGCAKRTKSSDDANLMSMLTPIVELVERQKTPEKPRETDKIFGLLNPGIADELEITFSRDSEPKSEDFHSSDDDYDISKVKEEDPIEIIDEDEDHYDDDDDDDEQVEQESVKKIDRRTLRKSKPKKIILKKMGPPCNCQNQCFKFVTEQERQAMFDKFYSGNVVHRRKIVNSLIEVKSKKTCNNPGSERRKFSRFYHLVCERDSKEEIIKVCKIMFLNTFCISGQVVNSALYKMEMGIIDQLPGPNRKGMSKQCAQRMEIMQTHIKSFPMIKGKHCQKYCTKRYLPKDLNLVKMYMQYEDYCVENNVDLYLRGNYRTYRDSFNNLKLQFHRRTNICENCSRRVKKEKSERSLED